MRQGAQQSQYTLATQTAGFEPDQVSQHASQRSDHQDSDKIQLAGAGQRSAGEQEKKGGNRKTELTREYSNKQDGISNVGQIVAHARPGLYQFRSYSSAPFAILRETKARKGKSSQEIADALHLPEGTVRNYLSEAVSKLGAANRIDAASPAPKAGYNQI